jgi:hydroxymethylbilane synthase
LTRCDRVVAKLAVTPAYEHNRLGSIIAYEFPVREMLPAVGQGIVAVECSVRDFATRQTLALIDDPVSHACGAAEREVLWVLNGHCNSPIAGYAEIKGAEMSLSASVLDHAGSRIIEASRTGPAGRPRELGRAVGLELLAKGAADIIERSRPGETVQNTA